MPNKSGAIGTATETAVVRVLLDYWPYAERRRLRGAEDWGDITGTPGIVWEVKGGAAAKAASDAQVEAWLEETETERSNAGAGVGVLVLPRKGIGPKNAHRWWAVLDPCSQGYAARRRTRPLSVDPYLTLEPDGPAFGGIYVRFHLGDMCRALKHWGY